MNNVNFANYADDNTPFRLHEKISAIGLTERSTMLVVFVLCFQYFYSLTKLKKNATFEFHCGKIEIYSLKIN